MPPAAASPLHTNIATAPHDTSPQSTQTPHPVSPLEKPPAHSPANSASSNASPPPSPRRTSHLETLVPPPTLPQSAPAPPQSPPHSSPAPPPHSAQNNPLQPRAPPGPTISANRLTVRPPPHPISNTVPPLGTSNSPSAQSVIAECPTLIARTTRRPSHPLGLRTCRNIHATTTTKIPTRTIQNTPETSAAKIKPRPNSPRMSQDRKFRPQLARYNSEQHPS